MARSIRIEYPGAFYHVMARGNRRGRIFMDDEDRHFFLKTLGEACGMTGWQVHAWVLMGNHYHLVIETPESNLVAGMQWLQNTYTRRFNVRHRQWGRLFGDRYKAVLVEGEGYYYETLLDYVHLNPVRAGLIKPGGSVMDYLWSSAAGGYAMNEKHRPKWLAARVGLEAFCFQDTAKGRRQWLERIEKRAIEERGKLCGVPPREAEEDARHSSLRRGWYWGSREFAQRALDRAKEVLSKKRHVVYRGAQEKRAHGEKEAMKLLKEGLAVAGLTPEIVAKSPGSEPRKVALARLIRDRTTMSMPWLAEKLTLRSAANASQQIRRQRKEPPTLPKKLQEWINLSKIIA